MVDNVEIKSNLIGSYNCSNILAAVTIGKYFDVPLMDIKSAIEEYNPTNNRSQIKKTKKNTLILDCYNANPSSCDKAIEAFKKLKGEDKRVFIGEMKELGVVSKEKHKEIAEILNNINLKQVIFVGKEYEDFATKDNNLWFLTSNEAKEYLKKENIKDSLILIKGSRLAQMENLIDVL
jgi:UDP-N-acetylmuramoyl-tripeptide--D-alanyl-D-alanine ligase